MSNTSTVAASVAVTNTSPTTAGADVVQLYVRDVVTSVATPRRSLRAFAKTPSLEPGETRRIALPPLDIAEHLGLRDARMRYVVEPGEFVISVGRSSEDLRLNETLVVR